MPARFDGWRLSARSVKDGNFEQPISVAGPSEVRQLARAFRAMRDELGRVLSRERAARADAQAANAFKDEFLAMVSHELRTPLTSILGWVHLAREGRLDPDGLERALVSIERSAGAQRRLIEDLLDATRSIKGTMRLSATDVRLDAVVCTGIESIRPAAEEKGIEIEEHVEPVTLRGDADRLQQVVANLVGNAVKFTPRGGRVTVAARQSGASAEITVCDTGDGIAPESAPARVRLVPPGQLVANAPPFRPRARPGHRPSAGGAPRRNGARGKRRRRPRREVHGDAADGDGARDRRTRRRPRRTSRCRVSMRSTCSSSKTTRT